jgi:hypothetical protein
MGKQCFVSPTCGEELFIHVRPFSAHISWMILVISAAFVIYLPEQSLDSSSLLNAYVKCRDNSPVLTAHLFGNLFVAMSKVLISELRVFKRMNM